VIVHSRPFRFGISVDPVSSRAQWADKARRVEELGFATLLLSDHPVGEGLAPFPALVAAGEATTSLRLGTFVVANDFRHPVVLARDAATADLLTDGRLELGMGAGWNGVDYSGTGTPWPSPAVRVGRLKESVAILKSYFSGTAALHGEHYNVTDVEGFPRAVQKPHPCLLIGGGGRSILSLAAREADIVAFMVRSKPDGSGLDASDATAASMSQKIQWVRDAAGNRLDDIELNVLIQSVDPDMGAVDQRASEYGLPPEEILRTPYELFGSVDEIRAALVERRELYGISYVVIFEKDLEAFAPVVDRLNGT
jgi:probable F420-dependent oxidoreductase